MHTHTSEIHNALSATELFDYATFDKPQYSPDHRYLSYLAPSPINGLPTVWLKTLGSTEQPQPLLPNHPRPLLNYKWLYTSTHITFVADENGDERGHLYLCDIATGTVTNLTPHKGARVLPTYYISAADPQAIVFHWNVRHEEAYDLYRYNLKKAETTLIEHNDGSIASWYVDHALQVRCAYAYDVPTERTALLIRNTPDEPWTTYRSWSVLDSFASKPLFFSPCNTYLYFVDSTDSDTTQLKRLHMANHSEEFLFQDPHFDVYGDGFLTDFIQKMVPAPTTLWGNDGSLVGFSFMAEKLRWHFFSDSPVLINPVLVHFLTHPAHETWIEAKTAAYYIIGRNSSIKPTEYWSYHRQSQTFLFLGSTYPHLAPTDFCPTIPVTATARDGASIPAYLTLPHYTRSTPLPVILKVHGGPWARDTYGFAPDVQYLTLNGYACLQVNYRGSTGYGKTFGAAGNKKLSCQMLDDVMDTLTDLAKRYPLDLNRVAFMGRSYGGFAALLAHHRYGPIIKAAVAQVPPTDLFVLQATFARHWPVFHLHMQTRGGHPVHEKELLSYGSPLAHASRHAVPTFISYGTTDSRVIAQHSINFLKAVPATTPVVVVPIEGEGHYNVFKENVIRYWDGVLTFLKEYLP